MAKYIPIGEPSNRAEEDAIRLLRDRLPEHFIVIGNFELHLPNRANSFEYDAVVIGEYGLYAVEIKGWTGPINGDIRRWYLDWGRVPNPFILTERKAKALRSFIGRAVTELPRDVFCKSILQLPERAEIRVNDPRSTRIVKPGNLYEVFVDEQTIRDRGPGALLDHDLRQQIQDALIPIATAPTTLPPVADYEFLGELDSDGRPYREFVASHRFLRTRDRVRLKLYSLDPLVAASDRDREYERVMRDIEALTHLSENPYIASAYDLIRDHEDELNFYLVSEWVGSRTLRDYIDDTDPTDARQVQACENMCVHLLRAVQFMHDQGIVHRNLNPAVIYVTPPGTGVPFKIADFDNARVVELPSIEGTVEQLGTEGYMAPELWQSDEYDHRVDIFSLGAIMFELLTGEPLYDSLSDMLSHEQTWANRREMVTAPNCRRVLDRLLKSDPNERPSELHEVIEEIELQRSA